MFHTSGEENSFPAHLWSSLFFITNMNLIRGPRIDILMPKIGEKKEIIVMGREKGHYEKVLKAPGINRSKKE